MTRINAHVSVISLCDEHLRAEHREIKRICNRYKQRYHKNKFDDIPNYFKLGTGHELFFINKPSYTLKRYTELYVECKKRGFDVTDFSDNWSVYENNKRCKFIEYPYSTDDNSLIFERITERLNNMKNIHYYSKKITAQDAVKILIKNDNIFD